MRNPKSTFKNLLPLLTIALLFPIGLVTAYTKVFDITVEEPIQVREISAISSTQEIWPGQTVTYVYEITNLAPRTYRIGIGGSLNGWENGQRKAWCGISAPTVTVLYTFGQGTPGVTPENEIHGEGSLKVEIPAQSTCFLIIHIYFHEDVEPGNWSFYLSIGRIESEAKG